MGHWTAEEFREHGHALIDWLADYLDTIAERPVTHQVQPGEVRAALPASPPEDPEPFAAMLADLDTVILPGLTHWQHPGFYGFFPAASSPPAILGELAAAGLGVQGMLWSTGPACTELENLVMDWLVELLDLPRTWRIDTGPGGGVIQGTASESTFTSLVVARHRAMAAGAEPSTLVAYTSTQAHSSVEKGARAAGIEHLRLLGHDASYALDTSVLAAAVRADRQAGLNPMYVCSTVGTTGTTAVDPVRAIAAVARDERMWHHVDAAYAGSAMVCPEHRHHQDGLDLVDSYVFNPHKWLLTNVDCSAFFVADRTALIDALSITPPYLTNQASASGQVVDYRDWHLPLGRRFRALKLWFVLRAYGKEGLRNHIRAHIALAHELAAWLESDGRFQVIAPTPFALVSFRHVAGDAATTALGEAVNASGEAYLTPSAVDGVPYLRICIGSPWTDRRHLDALRALLDRLA